MKLTDIFKIGTKNTTSTQKNNTVGNKPTAETKKVSSKPNFVAAKPIKRAAGRGR